MKMRREQQWVTKDNDQAILVDDASRQCWAEEDRRTKTAGNHGLTVCPEVVFNFLLPFGLPRGFFKGTSSSGSCFDKRMGAITITFTHLAIQQHMTLVPSISHSVVLD